VYCYFWAVRARKIPTALESLFAFVRSQVLSNAMQSVSSTRSSNWKLFVLSEAG
jgi:hypothetical protein